MLRMAARVSGKIQTFRPKNPNPSSLYPGERYRFPPGCWNESLWIFPNSCCGPLRKPSAALRNAPGGALAIWDLHAKAG